MPISKQFEKALQNKNGWKFVISFGAIVLYNEKTQIYKFLNEEEQIYAQIADIKGMLIDEANSELKDKIAQITVTGQQILSAAKITTRMIDNLVDSISINNSGSGYKQ